MTDETQDLPAVNPDQLALVASCGCLTENLDPADVMYGGHDKECRIGRSIAAGWVLGEETGVERFYGVCHPVAEQKWEPESAQERRVWDGEDARRGVA
jgi:hypothetical protein